MFKMIYKVGNHLFFHLRWEDRSNRYRFSQKYILPESTYSPWLNDKEFLDSYQICKSHTLVDIYRCYEIWDLSKSLQGIPGDIIEVGVWRGGTAGIMAKAVNCETTLFLCDTFSGVVKAGKNDNYYIGGEHADTNPELVKILMKRLQVNTYKILVGIFPEETSSLISKNTIFKLCHIDVDVYDSAKAIFDWVWPKIPIGGIVIFDDYGFAACEGITFLVNELSTRNDLLKIHNLNGHGILIKIA